MNTEVIEIISKNLNIGKKQVESTLWLFEQGATVPFIARYRKELTGSLDEIAIISIKNELNRLTEIIKRKESILTSIDKQGKLTEELRSKIETSYDLTELEDLYLPYKQKRKTRATTAKEKGLEPLAEILIKQKDNNLDLVAEKFLNDQVTSVEDALQGARDIIAEMISENQIARQMIRNLFSREAVIYSKVIKGKETEAIKYKDYFDYNELLRKCPSHRILAMQRGEREEFLRITIEPKEENAITGLSRYFVKGNTQASREIEKAVADSYKRLIQPSIETEFSNLAKEKADADSIKVFSENLRQLLLASPLGEKRVLAIDPGFRTGCKLVCLDNQGNLLHNENIYPHEGQKEAINAAKKIESLVNAYKIDAIAIGNGTASRETEHFIKKVRFEKDIKIYVVSENGASIYSVSDVAREEFPQYDVTVRGAVSIGRRLMDPLAELVKIDPKSIGVGQYQHDVDQNKLKAELDFVVESCVNLVGVEINTASKHLLTYISGLGPQLAQNIVDYRKENGPFRSRTEFRKVPRMGEKTFEQCAGFLRIRNAENPLDSTAVHPEAYIVVNKMAKDLNCSIKDLITDKKLREQIEPEKYINDKFGLPTIQDILKELAKPGRDPRSEIKIFEFDQTIHTINDLKEGMILPGIVTNITNFGVFVDIGIKENGLIHVSQLKEGFVSNPSEIVSLHQHLKVKVISIDFDRKRIQLSLKDVKN